ncbi:PREDICTED: leucine-rich repeat protein SHOC-2-like [Papilio xuthus]|uniref:Leucine-rich repeat protein SHOC-2-like n=1 Tax=Papilio xuthus TaxID=66420 RepID=A0AAJ6ZCH6_PAPXU|nr:PREDICTED: leucine-rich repeat protein SHOC-2-like [Papilio xuthus]
MEKTDDKPNYKPNVLKNGIIKDNITILDLSHKNIANFDEHMKLPPFLKELNLSHNKLENVPEAVKKLKNIIVLDISYNAIKYFDDTPSFCHTIEYINICNNDLQGPPAWIWFDLPKKLSKLNISSNYGLTNSFKCGYFEELIQFKTSIKDIKIYNCKLNNFLSLLRTFPKAKYIKLGDNNISYVAANAINNIPCDGLNECCDIEILDLSYTHISDIKSNIDIYKNLIEINLSQNELISIPDEFCNLAHLEVCILSCNHILYLPNNFIKLTKLKTLCLDGNELCTLPNIHTLPYLKKLDLYDNYLCQLIDLSCIEEIDIAENFVDEPSDKDYLSKKEKLRLNIVGRWDGRKQENVKPESVYSSSSLEDDDFYVHDDNIDMEKENRPPSSVEDWDSDDYWVPCYVNNNNVQPLQSRWLYFIKQKMEEGNFCPIDLHAVPVADRVNYEKSINPPIQYESDGQFDDFSGDDS